MLLYFLLKPYLGIETLSWVCILGAIPFAIIGFLKYNGMTAEKFILAWIKSEILTPKKLTFKSKNLYENLVANQEKYNKKMNKLIKVKNKMKKGAKKKIENTK